MTIYDLTEAFRRNKIPVIIAIVLLVAGILAMTFTIDDGKPIFRSGVQYESGVQIAVVQAGTETLTTTEATSVQLSNTATLYSSMLGSAEAAVWVGEQNGYVMDDVIATNTAPRTSVIQALVVAPTKEQAKAAAISTFDWLNMRLQQPLTTSEFPTTPTTIPTFLFDGPQGSWMNIHVAADMQSTPDELFLVVESAGGTPLTFAPSANAGATIRSSAVVAPVMTVLVSLVTEDDIVLDTARVAPPAAPTNVEATPEIDVYVSGSSIRTTTDDEGNSSSQLVPSEIVLDWQEGTVTEVQVQTLSQDVELALLTTDPGVGTTGGRRGPILAVAVLMVGLIAIVTTVIVADTWQRDRDARSVQSIPVTLTQQTPDPKPTQTPPPSEASQNEADAKEAEPKKATPKKTAAAKPAAAKTAKATTTTKAANATKRTARKPAAKKAAPAEADPVDSALKSHSASVDP